MRRALLVFLLVVAGVALAQEKNKLPFNPWESAKAGDWEVLTTDYRFEGKEAAALSGAFRKLDYITYRVRRADATEISIAFETVPELIPEEERIATVFSRTEAPAFDRLLDIAGEIRDVKSSP